MYAPYNVSNYSGLPLFQKRLFTVRRKSQLAPYYPSGSPFFYLKGNPFKKVHYGMVELTSRPLTPSESGWLESSLLRIGPLTSDERERSHTVTEHPRLTSCYTHCSESRCLFLFKFSAS
ncbi:hypothetical protein VTK73DRAFT_1579 [Phialemonium thermophilum]|uniref:Uncharacterized protein n=1 Tax=Phialemonium thermophilum TaxID=223376 RepID=A0ABR3Y480_9PEZI